VPRILPHRDHVPLHRLWAFTTHEDGLTLPEHAHIAQCTECTVALRACFNAESFGSALRDLNLDEDSQDAVDQKPRLRFLYVITGEKRFG